MGTTNRRSALDPAVLRRFTVQYEIPLPNMEQRQKIIYGYLMKHTEETEMGTKAFHQDILAKPRRVVDGMTPLEWLAKETEGFSGSHLLELCAQAAKIPIIKAITDMEKNLSNRVSEIIPEIKCRQCTLDDFKEALKTVKPMLEHSEQEVRPEQTESLN